MRILPSTSRPLANKTSIAVFQPAGYCVLQRQPPLHSRWHLSVVPSWQQSNRIRPCTVLYHSTGAFPGATMADLLPSNTSYTLPLAHRKNIARIALSPNANLLLTVDEDGHAILTNFPRRIVLHYLSFKGVVSALSFSPSGRHFAVGVGRFVEVWHTPSTPDAGTEGELEFAPFVRYHTHAGHFDTVQSINWSSDSRFFLTASKDLTARIWSLEQEEGFTPTTLAGHRQEVKAAWFSHDQETVRREGFRGRLYD